MKRYCIKKRMIREHTEITEILTFISGGRQREREIEMNVIERKR